MKTRHGLFFGFAVIALAFTLAGCSSPTGGEGGSGGGIDPTLVARWYTSQADADAEGEPIFELTADGSFFGNTSMGNNLVKVITSGGRITATTTTGETTVEVGSTDYEVTGAILTFSNLSSEPTNIFSFLQTMANMLDGNFYKKANASTPKLGVQPQNAIYGEGDTAWPLSVTASVTDGGTLSYQWYSSTSTSTDNGTLIDGETQAEYTPPITEDGTVYYYVVVTNTNNAAIGDTTKTTTSDAAKVEKKAGSVTPAALPTIDTHPQGATYAVGGAAPVVTPLSVTASVTDGGTLSYQWFSNTTNSTSGGTRITDATQQTYTPPITRTAYYYVIVTNTNTGVSGTQVRATTSNIATIEVTAGGGDEGPVDPGPLPPLDPPGPAES
jgi:hypothetical protein